MRADSGAVMRRNGAGPGSFSLISSRQNFGSPEPRSNKIEKSTLASANE